MTGDHRPRRLACPLVVQGLGEEGPFLRRGTGREGVCPSQVWELALNSEASGAAGTGQAVPEQVREVGAMTLVSGPAQ